MFPSAPPLPQQLIECQSLTSFRKNAPSGPVIFLRRHNNDLPCTRVSSTIMCALATQCSSGFFSPDDPIILVLCPQENSLLNEQLPKKWSKKTTRPTIYILFISLSLYQQTSVELHFQHLIVIGPLQTIPKAMAETSQNE